MLDNVVELEVEPVVEKLSRAERILRSDSARQRRKEAKFAMEVHSLKEEKEARERLKAKRLLEKQKAKKLKKSA